MAGEARRRGASSEPTRWDGDSPLSPLHYEWIALESLPKERARLSTADVLPCVLWVCASNGLIVLNKHLMSSDGFRFPMTLSSFGMTASWLLSLAACRTGIIRADNQVTPRLYVSCFLPVGLSMALMFYFGNLAYLFISVSFVQMLKTATPVVTWIVLVGFGLERPSARVVSALVVLAGGTALASYGTLAFSWVGVGVMLLSEIADALRLALTQLLLAADGAQRGWHPIEALMYLAPACSLCLLLGAAAVERDALVEQRALDKIAARPLLYLLAAVLGFVVNAAQVAAMKRVSALSLKVIGIAANSLLVLASSTLFGDELTALQLVGYSIAFAGFVAYNALKARSQLAQRPAASRREASSITSSMTSIHVSKNR